MLLQKRRAISYIIRVRDMMLLVCSFLVIQRHILSHDGADLRIHVTLVTNNNAELVQAGTRCIAIVVITSKSSPTCDTLASKDQRVERRLRNVELFYPQPVFVHCVCSNPSKNKSEEDNPEEAPSNSCGSPLFVCKSLENGIRRVQKVEMNRSICTKHLRFLYTCASITTIF